MRKKEKQGENRLRKIDALLEAMAEDSLTLSEEELRTEFQAEGEDPATIIRMMRESVASSIVEAGKAQLAAAKAEALVRAGQGASRVASLPIASVRKMVESAIKQPATPRQLSLAYRDGKFQSDEDIRSLAEDLEELKLLDGEGA